MGGEGALEGASAGQLKVLSAPLLVLFRLAILPTVKGNKKELIKVCQIRDFSYPLFFLIL